jgi:hypothetical protein
MTFSSAAVRRAQPPTAAENILARVTLIVCSKRRSQGVGNVPTGAAAVGSVLAQKVLSVETHFNGGGECLVELPSSHNAMHRKVIRP